MGFDTGTTQLPYHSIFVYQRRMLVSQVMDLNCLTQILAINIEGQKRMSTTDSFVPSFSKLRAVMQRLLHHKANDEVARGEKQQPLHPWKWRNIEKLHAGHSTTSSFDYETLEDYVQKLFVAGNAKTIDWIGFFLERKKLLGMSSTKKENTLPNGIAEQPRRGPSNLKEDKPPLT